MLQREASGRLTAGMRNQSGMKTTGRSGRKTAGMRNRSGRLTAGMRNEGAVVTPLVNVRATSFLNSRALCPHCVCAAQQIYLRPSQLLDAPVLRALPEPSLVVTLVFSPLSFTLEPPGVDFSCPDLARLA